MSTKELTEFPGDNTYGRVSTGLGSFSFQWEVYEKDYSEALHDHNQRLYRRALLDGVNELLEAGRKYEIHPLDYEQPPVDERPLGERLDADYMEYQDRRSKKLNPEKKIKFGEHGVPADSKSGVAHIRNQEVLAVVCEGSPSQEQLINPNSSETP